VPVPQLEGVLEFEWDGVLGVGGCEGAKESSFGLCGGLVSSGSRLRRFWKKKTLEEEERKRRRGRSEGWEDERKEVYLQSSSSPTHTPR
jgi:hypothetical protein